MEFFFDKAPLLFLTIALVTLVLGFAIVLDVSFANSLDHSRSGERRLLQRFFPLRADPDVLLLFFWASLVLAVVLSLLLAVSI